MPDGTERNPPDSTYTCTVRMKREGEYINKKRNMKKRIGTEKEKGERHKPKKKRARTEKKNCIDH